MLTHRIRQNMDNYEYKRPQIFYPLIFFFFFLSIFPDPLNDYCTVSSLYPEKSHNQQVVMNEADC